MTPRSERITRRDFVGAVGGSTALLAAAGPAVAVGPNDRVRIGLIGGGSRGNQLLNTFFRYPEVDLVAVADVDDQHAGKTAETIAKRRKTPPATMRDYRAILDDKNVDAVIIATPDHWHALPAIQAVLAGKDVYVEKPVGHNVAEGQAMIRAARSTNRIMAVGTQQRSSPHFQKAVEIVRSGQLGKVAWVQTWNYENISPEGFGHAADSDAPPYVDYDRWLGPAPKRPFNVNRFHMLFRWYFDYAGGMLADWGVHLNDIVLWALDAKAPQAVSASGGVFTTDDDRRHPDTLQVVYDFPGCTLTYSMHKGNGLKLHDRGYGILFCGTDGSLILNREGYEIIPDKVVLPYGIRSVKGDRPLRKIALKAEKAKGVDGMPDACRQLPRMPAHPRAPDLRHRDRPPFEQHLPPGQYRLPGRPQALPGTASRKPSRTTARPTRSSSASRARGMSCRACRQDSASISCGRLPS